MIRKQTAYSILVRTIIIVICALGNALTAVGRDYVATRNISLEDGLTNDFVNGLAIDDEGYIWVSTEAGLNRIAGNTCTAVAVAQQLAGWKITSLYWHQSTHSILIGTERGMFIYQPKSGKTKRLNTKDGMVKSSLNDIKASEKGLWLLYGNGKIQHLNDSTWTFKNLAIPHTYGSRCILDDGKGNLYIGHSMHGMTVIRVKSGKAKNYMSQKNDIHSLPGNNVRCIYQDRQRRIWVGTDCGIALFNPGTGNFTKVTSGDGQFEDNVYDIHQMKDGKLWVATDIGDIKVLKADARPASDGFLHFETTKVILSSHNPRSIIDDDYGNIWVGNHSTGVDFISAKRPDFWRLDYTDPLGNHPPVYAIAKDAAGGIWLAGEKELVRWQGGQITRRWAEIKRIGRQYIFARSLMIDRKDRVWVGIDDQGAYYLDLKTGLSTHIALRPENTDVHTFSEDSKGRIWIGGEFGIYLYENGKVSLQKDLSNIVHAPATTIIQINEECLFIATLGDGVYAYNLHTKKSKHLSTSEGLPSSKINQAIRCHDGSMCLATDAGLVIVADPIGLTGLTIYDNEQGLSDNHIRAMQQDQDGQVWMSTYKGISCLVKNTGRIYNYPPTIVYPFGGFSLGASIIDENDNLYFGSVSGVYSFNPHLVEASDELSEVQIISCEAYNSAESDTKKQLTPDDRGRISTNYKNNTLRIIFTIRNFAQAGKVEYSYKMKGMDDRWYDIGADQNVVFRGLRPGHYTFTVRVKQINQDWTKAKETSLEIDIAPPFWRTWWAYGIYTILAFSLLAYYMRGYKRKLKLRNTLELERKESQQKQELNEERLRFFTNITHELRTPLTLILGPLEDMMEEKQLSPQSYRRLSMIHKNAERLRSLINEILEFRKTETQNRRLTVARGDIGQFVREICLNYKELYHNPKVSFTYNIANNLPEVWFDSEIVTTILNNFLSNAIKYTEQGSITTSVIAKADGRLCISVADTGYGITPDALPHIFERYYQAKDKHQASGTGIGLALVKALAELHEGEVSVDSKEGKGSRFTLSIYMANNYPNALHKEDVNDHRNSQEEITEEHDEETYKSTEDTRPLLLVVEDNADIREYIADSLEEDFRIVQANNGEEGVNMAREQIPDIIISDIMMPKMDGIQLTQELKDDIRTSHVPIILLTAKNTDEDKEEGYNSGADSYLTKPFTARLLASRIQNLLTARRLLADYIIHNTYHTNTEPHGSTAPQLGKLDREFLEKLNSIIEENISTQTIDMPFVTDRMAMSHSTFYRKVKALTGMTAKEYIRKFRLQYCYHLLEDNSYNVSQAAMMAGFNQMAHFRETFKKEFGILPSEVVKKKHTND